MLLVGRKPRMPNCPLDDPEALIEEARRRTRRRRIDPHGIIYADDYPGGTAFEAHQRLVTVRNSHLRLLWQENNTAPK